MARNDLDIKVRALVEGVREVQQLTQEVDELQKEAGQEVPDSTRRYRRGVRQSRRATEQWSSSLSKVRGLIATLGVALAARRLTQFTTNQLGAADAINQTAEKLGLTNEELQEYRFAAEQVNVNNRALEQGIQRFSRRLAEARQGSGELADTLEQYDITLRNADGTSRRAGEVLRDLADAVSEVEDPSERLRIAFKAFDSEGAALVNILNRGSEGLDEFAQQARDAGRVIDGELIRQSARLNTELSNFFGGIRTQIQAGFLEDFVGQTGDLRDLMTDEEFREDMRDVGNLLGAIARAAATAGAAVARLGGRLQSVIEDAGELTGAIISGDFTQSLSVVETRIQSIEETLGDDSGRRGAGGLLRSSLLSADERAALERELELLRERRREFLAQRVDAPDTLSETLSSLPGPGEIQPTTDVVDDVGDSFDDAEDKAQKFLNSLEPFTRGRVLGFQESIITLDQFSQKFESLVQQGRRASLEFETLDETFDRVFEDIPEQAEQSQKEFEEFAQEAARNMQRSFSDFLFDPFDQGLDGMLQSFAQTIQRMIADALAADLLNTLFGGASNTEGGQTQALVQGFTSLFAGSFAGGGGGIQTLGQTVASLPSADGGGFTGPGPRIGGLDGQGGFAAMLHPQERVIDQTRGQGAQTPQVNIRTINAIREQDIADAMGGAAGERTILNVIGKNPESVRESIG